MAQSKKTTKNSKKNANRREPYQRAASVENTGSRIALGFLFLVFGAITAVSYFVQDGSLILGIRGFLSGILGYGYYAVAVCFIWVAIIIFQNNRYSALRIICILLVPVMFSAFIDLLSYERKANAGTMDTSAQAALLFDKGKEMRCGGVLSGLLVAGMVDALSKVGAGVVIVILLIVCVGMAVAEPQGWYKENKKTARSVSKTSASKKTASKTAPSGSGVGEVLGRIWNGETGGNPDAKFKPSSLIRLNDDNDGDTLYDLRDEPVLSYPSDDYFDEDDLQLPGQYGIDGFDGADEDEPLPVVAPVSPKRKQASKAVPKQEASNARPQIKRAEPVIRQTSERAEKSVPKEEPLEQPLRGSVPRRTTRTSNPDLDRLYPERPERMRGPVKEETSGADYAPPGRGSGAASTRADIKDAEKVSHKDAQKAARSVAKEISGKQDDDYSYYEFPPAVLLNQSRSAGSDSDDEIEENRIRLESALHSFGVNSAVKSITHGPTVTRYDIELEQGVKLTKVTNLSNDLALALGVVTVRIAPIPDEISTVGIEVPNHIINTVSLRDIIESKEFQNARSRLSFAIGKDIGGHAIVGNISKLPHMLIAGTTGSGKSVCMNSLIISLLFKAKPDEVKFIMIDPKMVELGIYNKIPHLYVPVVTEPKKAAGALQWSVVEMLKRYRLFSESGVRDLESYNEYCRKNNQDKLPQVVIVIDELADLMMAASKEVEESICRIAQMGRAAGMHLIIATQRPSADVITGLMKANIPSRIAFAVSSALESRIILDQGGADKLIGHGDMLYAPIGCGKPVRVQGAFVSDEEREKIIKFIESHSSSDKAVNEELAQYMDKAMENKNVTDSSQVEKKSGTLDSGYDECLPEAVEVVLEMKSCSVSMLQRRIKLGYSRAARVVDQMEELGIVGPYEGAKPRSVIVDRDQWNEIKARKLGLAGEDDYAIAAEMNED